MITRRWGQSTGHGWERATWDAKVTEIDHVQCPHCEAILELDPKTHAPTSPSGESAWCDRCGAFVCATAECATVCRPFLAQLEAAINRQYHRAQFARVAGLTS